MAASEIEPGLWLGDLQDAIAWDGYCVSVLDERDPGLPPGVEHVWILPHETMEEVNEPRVDFTRLEKVIGLIDRHLSNQERVLVSCGQGMERSPLTVVWYLHRKRGMDVVDAYRLVKEKRPMVIEHLEWMHGPGWPPWW